MNDLAKNHICQLMEAVKALCDAVGNQAATSIKDRIVAIEEDLVNGNEPRAQGDGGERQGR